MVLWATVGALIVRFGVPDVEGLADSGTTYVLLSLALAAAWWMMLFFTGSREPTVLGYGSEEYKRVIKGSLWLFGLIAIISYSLQLETARGYIGVALPAGLIVLLLARVIVRKFLHLERKLGKSVQDVLIIGDSQSAEHLAKSLLSQPMAGYRPTGVYVPGNENGSVDLSLPLIGGATEAAELVNDIKEFRPDAVALSGGAQLAPQTIRALGWALADLQIRLIMAPALTDIAGPRIHTQPLAGLPLIHVSTPTLRKGQRILKRSFDILGGVSLVLVLLPLLIVVAIAVRLDSPGPALFRQVRIGAAGEPFEMLKFRSMVVDAEQRMNELRAASQGNDVLFKLKNDPRVTRIGAFLRRFSIDEVPQLFNVIGGTMSLVGPRPPLPAEVEQYEDHAHRRLLVRPGMTGLWQVSGRSLLSWDDTVRLDLYYVENWSLLGDCTILLRTVRAVVGHHGAY
ncbi:sugar transferase [Arthrobacter sp. EH-1B-1]|uniref:Sugar transferase n=1 Tax=Arthrobacter vasquezii TaxID=2977629 RepID=A0ABT6CXF2_9MICC|nr:sugar transferase [Arthrobacter vasquezii]